MFVKELLELHDKYTALVEHQFGSNALFQKALKDAFMDFVNQDVGKFTNADLMSSFCDRWVRGESRPRMPRSLRRIASRATPHPVPLNLSILKTGGEKLSDEDVESFLEKTVQVRRVPKCRYLSESKRNFSEISEKLNSESKFRYLIVDKFK